MIYFNWYNIDLRNVPRVRAYLLFCITLRDSIKTILQVECARWARRAEVEIRIHIDPGVSPRQRVFWLCFLSTILTVLSHQVRSNHPIRGISPFCLARFDPLIRHFFSPKILLFRELTICNKLAQYPYFDFLIKSHRYGLIAKLMACGL